MCSLFCCSTHMVLQDPDITLAIDPSATSFLNGQLMDQSGHPLYTIETAEAYTIITSTRQQQQSRRRSSARHASSTVASIQWPRRFTPAANGNDKNGATAPDALVTVNGQTIPSGRLLRRRKLVGDGKSYKFRIDGYKPTFRWKRQGRQYQLFVSGLSQPIATLSSDYLTATFFLSVTGASIASYHNQDRPGLVSSVLLDYIVLTSLLLVTPCLEWRRVCGATATRTTMSIISSSDDPEEPAAFVYSSPTTYRVPEIPRNPFDDDCHPPLPGMPLAALTQQNVAAANTRFSMHPDTSFDLRRQPSTASTSSSRTLVQNIVRTVLASISSDQSSVFGSSTDVLSSEGTPSMTMTTDHHGVSTASLVTPPPPYERGRFRR